MNALARPVQRPRLARAAQILDEKTATFFVDKAVRAIAEDLVADRSIENSLRLYGHSLGNLKGQERFMARMARNSGRATVQLSAFLNKKKFLLIRDMLTVENNRLMIVRTTASNKQRRGMTMAEWEPFVISRHALVRTVQRVEISSVEDVFALLKIMWLAVERFMLAIGVGKDAPTTASGRCWILPMILGETTMGLLVARSEDTPLSLVTVYLPHMISEKLHAAHDEFVQVLDDETINETMRSDTLLAILPRLVV